MGFTKAFRWAPKVLPMMVPLGTALLTPSALADNQTRSGACLWGDNSFGLISSDLATKYIREPVSVQFLEGKKLKALAVRPDSAVAVLPNGEVIRWNKAGDQPTKVGLRSATQVKAHGNGFAILQSRGSIHVLDSKSNEVRELAMPSLGWFERVVDIEVGESHICALTNRHRVLSGFVSPILKHSGQMGLAFFPSFNPAPDAYVLHLVKLMDKPVKQIACGSNHTLFLTSENEVWGCGSNLHGQLALPFTVRNTAVSTPTKLLTDISHIAAGGKVSYFQPTDSNLPPLVVGDGEFGQFGTGSYANCQVDPLQIKALGQIMTFSEVSQKAFNDVIARWSVGSTHTFAETSSGAWLMWGSNDHGQLGNGKLAKVPKPSPFASVDAIGDTLVAGNQISGCYTCS